MESPRRNRLSLLILLPFALLAAGAGFWLSTSVAAWVVPSTLTLAGIGLFSAVMLPALLAVGNRARFFLKSLITVNAATIAVAMLLYPEGVKQAMKTNGAWPAHAIASYLPKAKGAEVTEEAGRITKRISEVLPGGPGALSYLFPPLVELAPPQPEPRGTLKVSPKGKKSAGAQAESVVVRYKKDGSAMIVTTRLNDKVSVPLIYDTGASMTTLDEATAKKLGISLEDARYITVETANGITRQPVVKLSSIEVGGARVEGPIEVAICSTCSLSGAAGLLGLNFSHAFITQIDPQQGTITFLPKR